MGSYLVHLCVTNFSYCSHQIPDKKQLEGAWSLFEITAWGDTTHYSREGMTGKIVCSWGNRIIRLIGHILVDQAAEKREC